MIKTKRAFSLFVAIFVILIMSAIASYIFYTSSTISKVGIIQYQKEQAKLYAKSYMEYAVLAIDSYDRNSNGNCIKKIQTDIGSPTSGQGYRVEVLISYIGNGKYLNSNCPTFAPPLPNPSTAQDTFMAIVDVYVSYKDLQYQNINQSPWITYHTRSLLKL